MPGVSPDERTEDQTDIRRWINSIDQARRMFGHRRDASAEPEEAEQKLSGVSEKELAELEEELEEG